MQRHILAAIDFSDLAPLVLQSATRLSNGLDIPLCVLHVNPEQVHSILTAEPDEQIDITPELLAPEPSPVYRVLEQMLERLDLETSSVQLRVVEGPVVSRILEEAHRCRAEMIVLGSHGHGALFHLLLGSVSEGVLREAPCPVVVVPGAKKVQ